ncbi:MAG: DUF58 domain-containing protein [Anaerolineae bacterium]|nr:DUF58 domain-containing protein [Anaerolineae bacterium]
MLRRLSALRSHLAKHIPLTGGVIYHYRGNKHESFVRLAERTPLLILLALIALLIVFPARVWGIALVGICLMVGICTWWAIQGARLTSFSRQLLHTWAQVGDRLEETFILQNDFWLPLLAAEITDHANLPGYNASTVRSISGNQSDRWSQKAISSRRGVFQLGPTTIRFGDPLGIFEVTCDYPQTHEILVVPPILHHLDIPPPSGGGQGVAVSRQRNLVETGIIGGVRDYQPGDPFRRIHWPLSMRHQDFLVKEFDNEKGGNIWLVLDLDQAVHVGEGQESTLEYAIIWAASWAWHLLKQGKGVGLFTFGSERIVVPPASGTAQLNNVLRALAPLDTQVELPLSYLLHEVKPFMSSGHSLVVFTPSAAPEWPLELMRLNLATAVKGVVLLDAVTFLQGSSEVMDGTHQKIPDKASEEPILYTSQEQVVWLRAMLSRIGIPIHLVQHQPSLDARPSAPGGGDWDYLVTPWGKVIVRSAPAQVKP